MRILCVDPSLRSIGVAVYYDDRLCEAATLKPAVRTTDDIAHRCRAAAMTILEWCRPHQTVDPIAQLVVEWPQVYRAVKSKGDPNDLLGLAGICAAVAALFEVPVFSYTPAEWAGQLPKATTKKLTAYSPRTKRIMSRLSAVELGRVPVQHDALDAIGLGLHHLGRLAPRRVFAGAT